MKKKVLLITVRSDVGGGPKHINDLLQHSQDSNVEFHVASPKSDPYGPLFSSKAQGFVSLSHRKFSPIKFIKILIYVRKNNISIVHSHGRGAGIYSRPLKLFGLSVFHTFHGVHLPKTIKDRATIAIEIALSYLTDRFLFVSDSERKLAEELRICNIKKGIIIPNGILLDPKEITIKSIATGPFKNIGIISRFDPHKNVLKAVELFSKLVPSNPQLNLNIAGNGEQGQQIKNRVKELGIENKVTFYGFVNSPLEFLKEQDLYLSTSLGEGLPYTVLEAMKVNTIPLLSNVPGHRDILPTQYLFDLDNIRDFLTQYNQLQVGIEHQFQNILEKNFNLIPQIKKITEVYDES